MTAMPSLCLPPQRYAQGTLVLPGSKSISNRVLLLAALAHGTTEIAGLLASDDTRVMQEALHTLGVALRTTASGTVCVEGSPRWPVSRARLFLGNAGTAFRPLTAALALMGGDYRLSGVPRMHERPIGDLVDALRALGSTITYEGREGYPPLQIGEARPGADTVVSIRGAVSSQFLTALLLCAPLVTADRQQSLTLVLDGPLISRPYVAITLALMRQFGVTVQNDGWRRFEVPAGACYRAPGPFEVEGDASSASYFLGLGAIARGPIRIEGVGSASIQGDVAFADVIEALGARVEREPRALVVHGVAVADGARLRAFDHDFNQIPDAAMTAAVLALYADGPCHLRNIGSWRVKETDRIDAMHAELERLGATVRSDADSLTVIPPGPHDWRAAEIRTYDDHRMAMSFSLAAFGPVPVTVLDPDCVAKTYPNYFADFRGLLTADTDMAGSSHGR